MPRELCGEMARIRTHKKRYKKGYEGLAPPALVTLVKSSVTKARGK
jgi:hypothetical protein